MNCLHWPTPQALRAENVYLAKPVNSPRDIQVKINDFGCIKKLAAVAAAPSTDKDVPSDESDGGNPYSYSPPEVRFSEQ